ncbi:T9SS type A sorting domain-containing protein [Kordia sp.]|uniref:T9SS type A sorting domain-containing protein n=1 Tax=Kordia sp. TaxID=1965332 RepID=UPI003D6A9005
MKSALYIILLGFFLFPFGIKAQPGTSIELGGTCFSPNPLILPYHSMQNGKPAYFLPTATVDGGATTVVVLWDPNTLGGIWAIQFSGQTHYYNTNNTANPNSTNIDTWQNAMQPGAPSCINSVTLDGDGTIGGSTLSVDNNVLNRHIRIYPNPNQSIFILSYSGEENLIDLTITDLTGKHIQIIPLKDFTYTKEINLRNLASGMYLIRIQSETSSVTKRMIIE